MTAHPKMQMRAHSLSLSACREFSVYCVSRLQCLTHKTKGLPRRHGTQGQCKAPDVLPHQRVACTQIGKPDIAWNSVGGGAPVGAEERARVEREREIACYLLQVPTSHTLVPCS